MSSGNFNISNYLLPGESLVERIDHCFLKKKPLTIYWTSMRLCWVSPGADKMDFIRHNQIKAQFSSQPPKCLLKIDYIESGSSSTASIVFLFKAFEFREKLIQLITPVVKKDDKSNQDGASKASSSSKNPEDSVPKPDISKMRVDEQSKLISPIEIKIRRSLLAKNAPLADLHRELVISGVLSEEEFWENRKNQLDDQLIQLTQPKAQSSGWVDIKAETNEGQGSKYTLTPEIIHSIFLQHPLVQKAYDEHVPANMSEESFWKRYFGSRYFHRNLNASQSGQSTSDELFDKLLEQDDAEAQSAASKFDHNKINRLVDLEASSGDRPDTGNRPDFTMVPGTDNKSLSLIRQFNQHSQQVLRNAKRKRNEEETLTQEKFYNEATLIEDLTAKKPVLEAPLRIESNSQYSQNHNQSDIEKQLTEQQNRRQKSREFLNNNRQHFGYPINKYWHSKANRIASDHLTSIVNKKASQASRHMNTEKISLPPDVLAQASKEFETITELLRHFWTSLSCAPTAERSHKLERITSNIKAKDRSLREWVGKMKESEKPNQALYKYLIPLFNNTARAFKVYKTLTRNKPTPTN